MSQGILPIPNHLKIDVEGLEHKVLYGASGVLVENDLQSVLVELNANIEQHMELIDIMTELGFCYDEQ